MIDFEICKYTQKRGYTYKNAVAVLKISKRTGNSNNPKRLYHCGQCGLWHLTSHQNFSNQQKKHPIRTIKESFDYSEVFDE